MKKIIDDLQANPIFRMSLGSKELFHSNFLEYLWCINKDAFIEMINGYLSPVKKLTINDYQLEREKENFDLCVFHKEGNGGKDIYDLVIENKVKSIPYKEQLKDYVEKAHNKGSNSCRFILLTLSKDFPDKGDENIKNEWSIVGYDTLKKGIDEQYLQSNICLPKDKSYITDYCDFIEQLVKLEERIIPDDVLEHKLFVKNEMDGLEKIRLHDLYIKLRCSWFALALKEKLVKEKRIEPQEIHIINKYDDREPGINLNININQGNGQIAVWVCDRIGKGDTFEVVIQGNQYRHGINQNSVGISGEDKYEILNSCYTRLSEFKDAMDFLNFEDSGDVNPIKKDKFRKTKKNEITPFKAGPFCCYGNSYIYRYKKIKEETIGELLQIMVNDILSVYPKIPNLL